MKGQPQLSMPAQVGDGRIPLCLLTGFLGAGKTTLLNRLVRHGEMAGTVVLINEFGQVGIDHHLVQTADESMLLLDSGCLCCSMRGDFVNALQSLDERASQGRIPPIRRIIVETTGLADPVPVLYSLREDRHMAARFFCDSLLTVVDSCVGPNLLARHGEAVRQIVMADRLLISKGDMVDRGRREALDAWLNTLNPSAPRLSVNHGEILPDQLFSGGLQRVETPGVALDGHRHGHGGVHEGSGVASFVVHFPQPVSWPGLVVVMGDILRDYGAALLRVKGIVNSAGFEAPVVIHCIRTTAHPPERLASWPTEGELADRRGRLVFIFQELDDAAIADIRARLVSLPDDDAAWRRWVADPRMSTRDWLEPRPEAGIA